MGSNLFRDTKVDNYERVRWSSRPTNQTIFSPSPPTLRGRGWSLPQKPNASMNKVPGISSSNVAFCPNRGPQKMDSGFLLASLFNPQGHV